MNHEEHRKTTFTARWLGGPIIYSQEPHGNLFGKLPLGAMPSKFPGRLGSDEDWDGAEFMHEDGLIIVTADRCPVTDAETADEPGYYGTANDSEIGPEIYPTTFYVVRVNGDNLDTHAAETLEDALELAAPPDSAAVHYGSVTARDAGAARLLKPREWHLYTSGAFGAMKSLACAVLLSFLSLPAFGAEPCKVNVNTATPEQLLLLARTGPVLAGRLASGRPYRHLEAVDAVKGVGPAWLAVNGPHVAFAGPTTCTEKVASPTAPKVAAQAPKL